MRIHIATGSNLGNRIEHLDEADRQMGQALGSVVRVSPTYSTAAVGMAPGTPDFLNRITEIELNSLWHDRPEHVMSTLLSIEQNMGRSRSSQGYTSRPIDLDIVLWGEHILDLANLKVPHPRMLRRRFVLQPLAELVPNRSSQEMAELLPNAWLTFRKMCPKLRLGHDLLYPLSPHRHRRRHRRRQKHIGQSHCGALGSAPLLEPFADNPFLEQFYLDPERYAFPVELSFLAQRYKQVKTALTARTLFRDALVADYLFAKSDLFAKITLPKTEYALFRNLFDVMAQGMPHPELILYLRPGSERQQAQIAARGRSYEQDIDVDYLARLEKAYERHFKHARGSRVIWVDTSDIDFVARPQDLSKIMAVASQPWKVGVHQVKP